jgi:membrane protease YdiL (CAAX protease family)
MSLIAFILHFLFERKKEKPTTAVLVAANVISAILFAAGHLPFTFASIGSTPLIIFRCFLLNGVFGLLFGYLYRKHGILYAMISHAALHVVSRGIWMVLI